MNFKYMYLLLVLVGGCSSNTNIYTYKNNDSLDYRSVSEKIFYNIRYDFVDVIVKDKVENYNVFIKKEDMSIDFYNKFVTQKIKDMGWVKIQSIYEDQDIYCYGGKNEMGILYPKKQNYSSENGKFGFSIEKKYMDYWVVYYRFKEEKTNNCKDNTIRSGI